MNIRRGRQPSEQFLRRLRSYGKPAPALVEEPVAPLTEVQPKVPLCKRLGRHAFRVLEVLALLFVLPTACVLIVDLEDRQTQRIAQAWQLVTQNAPGNSGKIQALEYLNSEDCELPNDPTIWLKVKNDSTIWLKIKTALCGLKGALVSPKQRESLQGVDLSKETHTYAVYLAGVELPEADFDQANLSGAYLKGANLSGASLRQINLSGADLRSANLSGAILKEGNLSGADLWAANLSGAWLAGADLSEASFDQADLSGAWLVGADLAGADLSGADLSGADLSEADLSGAHLSGTDLSGAIFTKAIFRTPIPYRNPLTCESLVYSGICLFSWPTGTYISGTYFKINVFPLGSDPSKVFWMTKVHPSAIYMEGNPPDIKSSLLNYFTAVGDECTWINGLNYVECASLYLNSFGYYDEY